jgi:two-component system CitB family response regulator
MIDVLVVDDDFRVAKVHTGLVERIQGFRVVGRAHTAAEARTTARDLRPDLVLLDIYLPDESGLDLLSDLDADVIIASAAADTASVRTAFSRGALHYLIKPFTVRELSERLTAYARYRDRLAGARDLTQTAIDHAVMALYATVPREARVPKGQSPATARLVGEALERADGPRSAVEIADEVGISRATAQRYLASLASTGRVQVSLRYGMAGRPEHQYAWKSP